MAVQRAVEQVRDVLGQRGVVAARAEREQDQQVDVARAEQHGEPGRGERGAQVAGEPRPGDAVGDAARARRAARRPRHAPRRARTTGARQVATTGSSAPRRRRREPERLGAPARVGLLHAPVGQVGQERAARARAQLLVVLLGQQADRHRQRRALHRHAVEVVERVLQRERQQPPPRGVQQPDLDGEHALGALAALLRAVHVRPRRQRQIVAVRPADVVDERAARVLEHDRVADRRAQLGQDLGHAAALQDQLGEAPVDLLPAREQRELGVDDRAVDGLGDLDEAHRAVEGDDRARPRARSAATTGAGTSRQLEPSSTASAAMPWSISDAVQRRLVAASAPAPSPVVSTSSPPLSRSSGSGISITCAQRISRPSAPSPITTSGSARRTTGRSSTSARLSMTLCHASWRKIRPTVHCGALT